jgi:hypothetical protein
MQIKPIQISSKTTWHKDVIAFVAYSVAGQFIDKRPCARVLSLPGFSLSPDKLKELQSCVCPLREVSVYPSPRTGNHFCILLNHCIDGSV